MRKSFIYTTIILFFASISSAYSQSLQKEQIKVWGNCGMCKKTIEKASKKAGASTASWDADKQMLTVSFDAAKTSSSSIQQAIAKTGYDTQDFTGDDDAYNNLHGCCQYDRKASAKDVKSNPAENNN